MSFDDAYGALTDHDDDARWAYGTGFTDPLAGVPTAVPAGVDAAALATYCWPGCWSSRRGGWRCSTGSPDPPTRCWPRSGPKRSRR